jgi:exportin-1
MINKDFIEYPEHRISFYSFLKVVAFHCFPALLTLSPQDFKLILGSNVWAFKHPNHDIADMGLNLCLDLINHFAVSEGNVTNVFFLNFYLPILEDIFFVLTDTEHKLGFKL